MKILLQVIEFQGRSQNWIARRMGIHPITLSRKLTGKAHLTKADKIKLSLIFDIPLEILFP